MRRATVCLFFVLVAASQFASAQDKTADQADTIETVLALAPGQ